MKFDPFHFLLGIVYGLVTLILIAASTTACQAANFNPGTEDPVVGYKGHEVLESSVWTFEGVPIREPNYDWANPKGGIVDGGEYENFTDSYFRGCGCRLNFSGGFGWGGSSNTVNEYFHQITNLFVDIHKKYYHVSVVPPSTPEVAPVPIPGGLLHLLTAIIFGVAVVRFFPQSLIDRPDRSN